MALERNDILTEGAISAPLQLSENMLVAYQSAMKLFEATTKFNSAATGEGPSKHKKQVEELTVAQQELAKIQEQIIKAQARNTEAYRAEEAALKKVKEELKQKSAVGDKDVRTIKAQTASINELEMALKANRNAYKALRSEEERNSESGKELLRVIAEQDAAYKTLKASMGQHQDQVGNYAGATKELKLELKAARDEMAGIAARLGTTSPEFLEAAKKAGALKDQLNDINDAVKNTEASGIENVSNSFGMLTGQLRSGDFGGAAQSARQMAESLRGMSSAEIIGGLKSIGGSFLDIGKALIANPIFLVAGALTAAYMAYSYFADNISDLNTRIKESHEDASEAALKRIDHEIALLKVAGADTFQKEKEKQLAIIKKIDEQLIGGRKEFETDWANSLLTARHQLKVKTVDIDGEEKRQLLKQKRDAEMEIEIINAQTAKAYQDRKAKELQTTQETEAKKTEAIKAELQKRIEAEIEADIQKAALDLEKQNKFYKWAEDWIAANKNANFQISEDERLNQEERAKANAEYAEYQRQQLEAQKATLAGFVNESQTQINSLAGIIVEAATSNQLDLQQIAKRGFIFFLDMIERQMLAVQAQAIAEATAKSLLTPDSIATFGASGGVRALILSAIIKAAFAVARAKIMSFEKGTSFAPGGPAIVGEAGPELIKSPGGRFSLSPGKATLTYLERGSKVFTADETLAMLATKGMATEVGNNTDLIALGRAFQYATEKSAEKIIRGYMKARPGDLVKNGSLLYEHKEDESRNRKLIRKSVMSR